MKRKIIALFLSLAVLTSCEIAKQLGELQAFAKCQFRLKTVQNLSLAGVNIQNIKNFSAVSILDAAKITTAYMSGTLPLTFILNVEVKNPNQVQAGLNQLDWILLIDGVEMVRGVSTNRVQVPPNGGVNTLPLQMSVDLKKALTGKAKDAILNFGFNLAGVGNTPSRITLKAKPTLYVANTPVTYPGYLTIQNQFTSN